MMKKMKDYIQKSNNISSLPDEKNIEFIYPRRVLKTEGIIENADMLLMIRENQATLEPGDLCSMEAGKGKTYILLDFGIEIHGGIQITTHTTAGKVRVTFGESAMEAMSDIGNGKGATNDHAIRDSIYALSWLGTTDIGNTGFRFVKIELAGDTEKLMLKSVRAKLIYRDIEYKGTFECSDERLNRIWQTAVYTVQLNMQDFIWDGIKRDRLVWIGDMHPEVSAIQYVFGENDCVKKSLDLIRDITPLPSMMNGIPAYSMWWILIHRDWYRQNGEIEYLRGQHKYIIDLVKTLSGFIGENGASNIENNFLDWPSSTNPEGQKAGVHALFIMAMKAAAEILSALNDDSNSEFARLCAEKLSSHLYDANGLKQAYALQMLAGLRNGEDVTPKLLDNGVHGYSTFLGYYILKALGEAEKTDEALEHIKTYWGTMLDLGATTFWEDFDISWAENSSKLDEILEPGSSKKDIHGDFGGYCYTGYRHSLCHGWASGPAPFLMEYVLGIRPIKPGCKQVLISPDLGSLTFAKGSYPTPYGTINVEHIKLNDGEIKTSYDAPNEIDIVLG